jgi:nitrite reductase/ring-hydroxylating ferredoxin subunit
MSVTTMTEFRSLEKSDRLPENYVNPYYLDDLKRRVSVARVGGKLYAFNDLCPFDSAPLSAGLLTGTTLMCQCDGSQFDVTSGRVLRGPATSALEKYEVREQKGEIQIRL